MHCPNISSPQWKNLVEKIGKTNAWREFFKYGVIPSADNYDVINDKDVLYQNQTTSTEGQIVSEKTIRDLAARMSDRIGMPFIIESDRTKEYKGKVENNTAYINLAYATLDTPIHEILGHPIIRAIKTIGNTSEDIDDYNDFMVNYWGMNQELTREQVLDYVNKNYKPKRTNQLYQNLLKELETGKGKEVLDRIKRDYQYKYNIEKINSDYGNYKIKSSEAGARYFDTFEEAQKALESYAGIKYTLEEQQEEAIVELLGLMTAEKLDNVKDGKLISLLKRLLKEMKQFIRSLINQKEVEIDKLPDNMTINDLADLLAYSNNKLILPGYEVEYTTPDNMKFKTYQEASNHIGQLAKSVRDVNLEDVKIQKDKQFVKSVSEIKVDEFNPTGYDYDVFRKDSLTGEWFYGDYDTPMSEDKVVKAYNKYLGYDNLEGFIDKNKEYEQSKEIIEEWKKVNNIQYNPEEIYSRGQEFSSVVGAYSSFDVNLMMQNLLQHIEDNKKAGGKFAISAYTKPVDKKIGHLEGGGGKIKFKIYPQSNDILWASNTDVFSGSVWDASEKVNKDKKSELLGVSYTKYPSLQNVTSVQPNLAAIVDNLEHYHNELGITLTGNNFRLEYDEDIPYKTKKIIDSVNAILDQKYGKLIKPEIKKQFQKEVWEVINTGNRKAIKTFETKKEAEDWYSQEKNEAENLGLYLEVFKNIKQGIQPTQTKDNLKESIESVKNKTLRIFDNNKYVHPELGSMDGYNNFESDEFKLDTDTFKLLYNIDIKTYNVVKKFPNYWQAVTKSNLEYYSNIKGVQVSKIIEEQKKLLNKKIEKFNKKEYTEQALINTKIAALKEVAKKYPRSLIRSEVKPIFGAFVGNTFQPFDVDDLPFQRIPSTTKEKNILYSIKTKSVEEIAQGLDSNLVKTKNDVKYISYIKSLFLNKINNSKESGNLITPTEAFNSAKNDFTVALNKINTALEILTPEKFNIIKTGDSEKIEKFKTQINVNFDINKNTTYEEFVNALSEYKNNYTNIINNFDRYEDYVVLELAHLGLKINKKENTVAVIDNEEVSNNEQDLTEDNSGISVEELNTERFGKSINETNLKNTARVRVKTLLLTLKTGETEFGIPLYANPDDVFDDLLEAGAAMSLSGYTKYDTKYLAFLTAIQNKAAIRPYLNDLIAKLAKYEVNNQWEKINEILTVASVAYVNEKLLLYKTVKVGNEIIRVNDIKIIDSNVDAVEKQVAKDWLIQHQTSDFFIKDVAGNLKPNPVKVNELNEQLLKGRNGNAENKAEAFIKYFDILGLTFQNKDVDYIFKNISAVLGKGSNPDILFLKNNLLENIYNSFLKNIDVFFDSQSQYGFQDERTDMLKLARLYYNVNPGLYNVASSKTADGKTKYLYIQPNYVENKKRQWERKQYSVVTNSALVKPNIDFWENVSNNKFVFSLDYFTGMREQESNKTGKVRKNYTAKDQYITYFLMHQANIKTGNYLAFTLSDKTATIQTKITKEFFVDSKATPVGKGIDYYIDDNGDVVFTEKLKNQIYNSFIEPEISRILAALNNKSTVNLENFNISSKLFYVIPNVNTNPNLKEFRKDLYSGKFDINQLSEKYSTIVGQEVLNELELSATQQVKELSKIGIFKFENGNYKFPLFDNSLGDNSYVSKFRNTNIKNADLPKMMLLDLKLNYYNAQVKTIQFLRFDPMFAYKHAKGVSLDFDSISDEDKIKLANATWDEFSKRAAALVAPGSQGNWQWIGPNGTPYRAGTELEKGKDGPITYTSITANDYETSINGINNNVTDAQELVIVQEYIDMLMSDGKIPYKVWLSIFNKIKIAGPGGYYALTKQELGYLFSPSKPVHVNDVNVGDENSGLNRFDYIKSSRYPLIPEQEAGSERDKMRIWMEKNNIRSLNFISAKKLGRPAYSVTIFNKDGNFVEPSETDTKNAIQELSRDGFRTQQEIPEQKQEIKTVSQMNRTLFDKMLDSVFSISGMQNIKGSVAKQIKEKVRSKLFDINANKLKAKLGDLEKSHEGLHKLLKDVILNDTTGTYTSNDLDAIKLNDKGFFQIPLEFQSKKIQSLINTLIDKNIMLKVDGSSFVQVSGVGAKYELSTLSSKLRSSIIWLDSHVNKFKEGKNVGLDYISLENGKVKSAQVIVSQYMIDGDGNRIDLKDYITNINGIPTLDTSKFSPELFQLVATRIPNQSLVSTLPVEVVGFLPDYMENTIIVPDGITGQMGSDFDVDKLYTYMSKAYKNENDEYKIQQYALNDLSDIDNFTEEQLKQLYVDLHWMVLTHPDAYAQITKSVDMKEPKSKVELRNKQLSKYNITKENQVNLPLDFSTSINRFIDNKSGKTGVAVFANLQSAQADFQDKVFRLGSIDSETDSKVPNPIKVRFNVDGKSEVVDLLYIGKTGSSTSFLNETRSISDNINIMFSESVDNAKNLFLREFNWDEKAMSAIGFFAMLSDENNNSIPIEFAMDLTSQPAIVTLFDEVDTKQDSFGEYDLEAMKNATKELKNKIADKIDADGYLSAGKQAIEYLQDKNRDSILDPELLSEMWLVGQAVINNNEKALKELAKDLGYKNVNELKLTYYTVQYDSLNLFERLNNAGRELMTILGVAYLYTKGIGPNVFSANQKTNQLNIINNSKEFIDLENITGKVLINDDDVLLIEPNGEIGESIKQSLVYGKNEIYNNIFPISSGPAIKNIVNKLLTGLGKNYQDLNKDNFEFYFNEVFDSIISVLNTHPDLELFNNVSELRNKLINGETSIGYRISELKKNPEYANNRFLKNIEVDKPYKTDVYLIKFKDPFGTSMDESSIFSGFYELALSENNDIKELAKDLALYPYITGNAGYLLRHIPNGYYNSDEDFVKAMSNMDDLYGQISKDDNFISLMVDQIVQNNPNEYSTKFRYQTTIDERGVRNNSFKKIFSSLIQTRDGNTNNLSGLDTFKIKVGEFTKTNDPINNKIAQSLKIDFTDEDKEFLKSILNKPDGINFKYPNYIIIDDSEINDLGDYTRKTDSTYLYKKVSAIVTPDGDATYKRINILEYKGIKQFDITNPDLKSSVKNNNYTEVIENKQVSSELGQEDIEPSTSVEIIPLNKSQRFTRESVKKDTDYMYLFTDNAERTSGSNLISDESRYSAVYGEGKKYPTMTQAIIRGLDNAFPITTMVDDKKTQWTDDKYEEYKTIIDSEIEIIKNNLKYFKGIKFSAEMPFGKGAISNMKNSASKIWNYLNTKLAEIGIDNTGDIPIIITTQPSTLNTTQEDVEEITDKVSIIQNEKVFDPMAMLLEEQSEEAVNDAVNQIFGNGMDSKTVLNNFYKVASPFYKSLLKLVSSSGGVGDLKFVIDYNLMDPGQYDSFNKVITINPNLLKESGDVVQIQNAIHDVIIHELLHYLTVDVIKTDKSKLSAEQKKWVMSLENLFKSTQEKILNDPKHSAKLNEAIEQVNKEGGFLSASDKSMYYGLTNIYDFISMLMSDVEFQNFMNETQHSKEKSIVDRFIEVITELIKALGINVKDQSVLKEGIINIVNLINERNNVSLSSTENQRSIITSNRNELIKNNISNIVKNLNLKSNCK